MRSNIKAAMAVLGLVCGGCASDGLSPREDSTHNLSAAVYESPADSPATQPTNLAVLGADAPALPIRVGVVQIGEVAPPESMLKAFAARADLFSVVEPMPGIFNDGTCDSSNDRKASVSGASMAAVRKTAAGMGLNYVLFYGGTVDCTRTPTPLEAFNLTIIGGFIVPSDQVSALGKAAGSLMEVSTGRTVLYLSADAKGSTFLPTFVAVDVNDSLTIGVREELVKKMTEQTMRRLSGKPAEK
jgi:hypothetical protein